MLFLRSIPLSDRCLTIDLLCGIQIFGDVTHTLSEWLLLNFYLFLIEELLYLLYFYRDESAGIQIVILLLPRIAVKVELPLKVFDVFQRMVQEVVGDVLILPMRALVLFAMGLHFSPSLQLFLELVFLL